MNKRVSKSRKRRYAGYYPIVLGVGVVIALFIGLLVLHQTQTTSGPPTVSSSGGGDEKGGGKEGTTGGGAGWLKKYSSTIADDVARGLHLGTTQVKAQLQAGKTLSDVAVAQGISNSQLVQIEINAIKDATTKAVSAGDISQTQADGAVKLLQNDLQTLDRSVHSAFVGPPASTGG